MGISSTGKPRFGLITAIAEGTLAIGSRLFTRIEGRCIKHHMGAVGVKVYDKFSRVLRVETTVNDLSFFKHHRKVKHKGRHVRRELAPLKRPSTA